VIRMSRQGSENLK